MGGSLNVLDANYAGGADATGAADSAAAFNAAVAALDGGPGYILVPGGSTYELASTVGPLVTGQYIVFEPGVFINWTGTGDCFRWVDTSTYLARTVQGGGIIGHPVIDGTNDGAGSCGLHAGDILGFRFDVAIQNFSKSGDILLHLDNQNYWTEQAIGTAYLNNGTQFVVFDCGGADTSTGSFDRGDFTFYINQYDVAYNGIVWQNGASQVGGRCRVLGNFETANSAPSSVVLTITGTVPAGHPGAGAYSGLSYLELDVNVEADEGDTYGPQTIHFGASENFITACTGNLSFGAANTFQESNSAGASQFSYQGTITGDSTLSSVFPNRSTFDGEVFFDSAVAINGLTGATAGCRLVGAIASGTAPTSGTFVTGDMIVVLTGGILICTAGGTHGTWTSIT